MGQGAPPELQGTGTRVDDRSQWLVLRNLNLVADRNLMATLAGNFPQSQISKRRKAFFHKHWWRVLVLALLVGAMVLGLAVLFPDWSVPGWTTVPLVLVIGTAMAWSKFDGTYYLEGARDAERWTSKDLRKTLGRGWHVVDGIHFWHGDADHVVVGPSGVYVVEVKNTDSVLDLSSRYGRDQSEEWVDAVRRRARSTRLLLNGHGVEVGCLIVIWGLEVSGSPQECAGVPVIHRRDLPNELKTWLDQDSVLSSVQVQSIADDLVAYRMQQEH